MLGVLGVKGYTPIHTSLIWPHAEMVRFHEMGLKSQMAGLAWLAWLGLARLGPVWTRFGPGLGPVWVQFVAHVRE